MAWDSGPNFSDRTVYVRDLDRGITKIVATAGSPEGQVRNIVGSKDTLIYMDLARIPSDENQLSSPWKIYAVDLKSGDKRVLLASHDRETELVLGAPHVDWPWMVDATEPRHPTKRGDILDVYAIDLRDGSYHVIVPDAVNPAAVYEAYGVVVYGVATGRYSRDLYSVPVDGSRLPRRLTTSGQVSGGTFSQDGLTWEQPLMGPPSSLWFMSPSLATRPVKFASSGSDEVPGRGFVIWLTAADEGEHLVAAQPCPDAPRVQLDAHPSIPARWVVSGNRVVWATEEDVTSKTGTIHVIDIQPN